MMVRHFLTLGRGLALGTWLVAAGVVAGASAEPVPSDSTVHAAGVAAVPGDSLGARERSPAPRTLADEDSLLLRWGAGKGLNRESHGALAPDRLQHASLAFAAGLALGLVTESPAAAGGGAAALGVGKELTDDHFDRGDLIADLLGAALAALVTAGLRR
jgi:hypothetical protein